jgi:acetyltransferase-like isoleucine patch superfamily enzyme
VRERWGRLAARLNYWILPRIASEIRKRIVILRNPHAHIEFRGTVYVGPGFSLHMPYGGHFVVEHATEFRRGFRAEFGSADARIEVGAGSYFTYDVLIQCSTSITFGQRCGVGQSTFIVDGNHRFRDLDTPMLQQGFDYRPLRFGDDVQVFSKATIMANCGNRAIIAANAVVTKPVPDYCIAAGVPAKVIEYYGPPGSEPPELAERSGASSS